MAINVQRLENHNAFMVFEDENAVDEAYKDLNTARIIRRSIELARKREPGTYLIALDVQDQDNVGVRIVKAD